MGRYKKMTAAAIGAAPTGAMAAAAKEPTNGTGPDLSQVDPVRRARIEAFEPESVRPEQVAVLRPWVVWCVTRVEWSSHQNDLRRIGQTYALLADDLGLHGEVDVARAFVCSKVREHLERRRRDGLKPNSVAAIQSNLFAIGRVIAPRGYPRPPQHQTRPHVKKAASAAEVRGLELAAMRIPGVMGQRLRLILDLTTHAGARAKEITHVRGRDIREEFIEGRVVTTVRLHNPASGCDREVPVLDPVVASRLVAQAKKAGSGGSLLGTPGNMKNQVNKVFATVRSEHCVQVNVTADQLRGYYITELAKTVPATTLMALTDLGNSHSLYEYTKSLTAISVQDLTRELIGATR